MYRDKKKRIIILVTLIILLGIMTIGYAAFQAQLSIKGNSKITSNWDIRITNVTETKKTGSGESTNPPTWTHLTANMEADLYEKGDSVEYEVTIENKGSLDAKLDDIISNIKSNNEAVKISFEGYIKGEKLFKGETKIITVKIEYDSEFTGEAEGSGEVEVSFDYSQAEGGSIVLPETYLLTYDFGGGKSNANNEYLEEGVNINLNYIATKPGYNFIGWNTDQNAMVGLDSLQMPSNSLILYAIYKKQEPPVIDNVSTSATTNSITAVVSAHDEETDITKYEFSINGGEYIDNGNNNVYTFEGLSAENIYKINVRVTNKYNLTANWESEGIKTQILQTPTFKEEFSGAVTINYPEGCGSKYTCSYIKDNETEVIADGNTTVYFRQSGNILAKVTDGTNSVSSTYTVSNLVTVANKYTATEKTFGVFGSSDPSMELESGGNAIVCNSYEECYGTTGKFEYDSDGALILNDKNSIGVIGILDLSQSFSNIQKAYSLAMTIKAPTKQGTTNLNNNYPTTLFAITDNIYHMLWVGFYQDYIHVYCYHTGSSVSNTAKDQTSEGFTSLYIGNYNEKTFNLQITAAINGKSRIYINGNMVREFNSGSGAASATKAYLGDLRLGRKLKFTGKIYDMTFYDKVISSSEINQNWLNSKNLYNIN